MGLAIVMHTPPATLVFEHPDWKSRAVPGEGFVMLKMAVKRRPVVGGLVGGDPIAEVAASSSVSTVSCGLHAEP